MATIKDVARAAGLSITTVSRALNNHDDVADTTRAHITAIADQLGYHPSHLARSLQETRSYAVGLVIPQLVHRYVDSFWLEFIGGVTQVCAGAGLDLLLCTGKDLHAEHGHYQRLVRSRRVDGVIACDVRVRDPRLSFLRHSHAPFVAFGRTLGHDDFSWVDVDGAAGVREAVAHLIAFGHRRIGFLGTQRAFSFSHFRYEGYVDALLEAGIAHDERLVLQDLDTLADLHGPLTALLAQPSPPTALIACADFLAANALRALRSLGQRVPADLSLVAFDDTLVTQHAEPPISCIRQENEAIGRRAAEMLIEQLIGGDCPVRHELFTPRLVGRGSVAAVQA